MRLLWEAQQQRRAGRARAMPPPINTNGDFMEGDEDDDQAPAAPTEEVPSSELEIPTGFADEAEYAAYLEMVIRDELRATSTAAAPGHLPVLVQVMLTWPPPGVAATGGHDGR